MYESVKLWIMGDFWKEEYVKWGSGSIERETVSIPCGSGSGTGPDRERYFIFTRFAPHCYTLVRISDLHHAEEG